MRLSLIRLLVASLALSLCAADASAGPLRDRFRARRGGCPAAGCTPSYAPPAHAAASQPYTTAAFGGGCAGGRCPTR